MNTIKIKILNHRIKKNFCFPNFATSGSSGLDLRACLDKIVTLKSKRTMLIPTGIAMYIANPNITAFILPRSGLGHKKGIVLGNLIGLIDSDYQGELMISIWNRSTQDFDIHPDMRVAQIVFVPIIRPNFSLVQDFNHTERAQQGFGHSGLN